MLYPVRALCFRLRKRDAGKKSLYRIDDSFKKIVVTKNGLARSTDEKGVETVDLFEFLLGMPTNARTEITASNLTR